MARSILRQNSLKLGCIYQRRLKLNTPANIYSPGNPTQDLWPDSLEDWSRDPSSAFVGWLARRPVARAPRGHQFRQVSADTYGAMFHTWCEFLDKRALALVQATPGDAQAFFNKQDADLMAGRRQLQPVSRRRYLQIFDQVYKHLATLHPGTENPFLQELSLEAPLLSPLPAGLSNADLDLISQLVMGAPASQETTNVPAPNGFKGLKRARDQGVLALLLGAGLRSNELCNLRLSHVLSDFSIHIEPQGVHRTHRSVMLPSGPWRIGLANWLELRRKLNIPGDICAPANSAGEAFSPSGLFRRVRHWFELSEVKSEKNGPNVLRNTFARLALDSGQYTLLDLQECLGHEELKATEKHERIRATRGLLHVV